MCPAATTSPPDTAQKAAAQEAAAQEAAAEGYKPYRFQRKALDASKKLYSEGISRQLGVAATGVGKTVISAFLPDAFPELASEGLLFLAHKDELVFQAAETFREVNPSLSVAVEKAEYRARSRADVVVASVPTVGRRGSNRIKRFLGRFGIVVVDETHHAKPLGIYDRALSLFGLGSKAARENEDFEFGSSLTHGGRERLLIGLTATPSRSDGIGLEHFYDEIPFQYDIRWAINHGYLVDLSSEPVYTDTDLSSVGKSGGDYKRTELEEAINLHERNEIIVSAYKQHGAGQAIAYCAGVEHAHDLAAAFRGWDVAARAIDASTEMDERRRIVKKFREGEIDVLTNYGCLIEGFDAPRMQTILMARPTKSRPLYIQTIGRALRPWPGLGLGEMDTEERVRAIQHSPKPVAKVLEFTDNTKSHGPPVSVASLFGLPANFDTEGQPVNEVVQRVEELERQNPAKPVREATSLEEIETLIEKINVWDLTNPEALPDTESRFRWFKMSSGFLQLEVPGGTREDEGVVSWRAPSGRTFERDPSPWERRTFYVQIEKNTLGKYDINLYWPEQYVTGGDYLPEHRAKGKTPRPSRQEAIGAVDDWVEAKFGDLTGLMVREASWSSDEATTGQLSYLDALGVPLSTNSNGEAIDLHSGERLTKGKASALISAKKQMD